MFIYNEKYVSKKEGYYYSCPWIEHGLVFFKYKLAICCNCGHLGSSQPLLRNNFVGQKINWQRVFKIKDMYRKFHKKGKIHSGCINCPYLEEAQWDGQNYINHLYISHWTHCNSKCIYCYSAQNPEEFSINKTYNIMPYIKELYEKGYLRPGGQISFGGGEPTILNEFDELLDYFIEHSFYNIRVHTSGIKYSKALARAIDERRAYAVVSVDAGSSSVYEKVKQVPCYDKVRDTIRRYALATNFSGRCLLSAKFIIIPGINDSVEEIEKWLQANAEAGLYTTVLDLEEGWYKENRNNIPEHIYKLIEYTRKRSKQLKTNFELYERLQNVLKDKKKRKAYFIND